MRSQRLHSSSQNSSAAIAASPATPGPEDKPLAEVHDAAQAGEGAIKSSLVTTDAAATSDATLQHRSLNIVGVNGAVNLQPLACVKLLLSDQDVGAFRALGEHLRHLWLASVWIVVVLSVGDVLELTTKPGGCSQSPHVVQGE